MAEELTAETFARACKAWRRYDPRRGSAMPSPDPRFEALANELRTAKPAASPELRERVAELVEAPARERWVLPRISARRAAFVLVPACLAAAVGAALIHGVVTSGARRTAG